MTDLSISTAADSVLTLDQTFNSLPVFRKGGVPINSPAKLLSDPTFSFKSGYVWEHNPVGTTEIWPPPTATAYPAWTSNGDADVVPNQDMIDQTGINPYSWNATDGLVITPQKTSSTTLATIGPRDQPGNYISGALTTYPYCQTYGVFAAVMKVPKANGMWPAFWMLPKDLSWPPELDIMEVLGKDTTSLVTTLHTGKTQFALASKEVDLSLDYHEYAVEWGPNTISWFIDRKQIFTQPTPVDLHKPCYLLCNLAIGKPTNWGGAPAVDASGQPILAPLKIRSIKAWQRLSDI